MTDTVAVTLVELQTLLSTDGPKRVTAVELQTLLQTTGPKQVTLVELQVLMSVAAAPSGVARRVASLSYF